jgi:hypothetical protein
VQAPELTAPERRLELALRFFTAFFIAQALLYPVLGLFASAEFPFVANSFAKDGLFAVLCFIGAGDVRRNGWATQLVVLGHALIVIALLSMLAFGNHDSVDHTFGSPLGTSLSPALQLLIWAAAASATSGPISTTQRWRWPRCSSSDLTRSSRPSRSPRESTITSTRSPRTRSGSRSSCSPC